ncbi:MAG: hypothetical protein AAFY21_23050 [Cyanobacteria bacterium J06641_2]
MSNKILSAVIVSSPALPEPSELLSIPELFWARELYNANKDVSIVSLPASPSLSEPIPIPA